MTHPCSYITVLNSPKEFFKAYTSLTLSLKCRLEKLSKAEDSFKMEYKKFSSKARDRLEVPLGSWYFCVLGTTVILVGMHANLFIKHYLNKNEI